MGKRGGKRLAKKEERERWEEGRSVPADRFLTDARHARQIDAKTTHERA